MLSKYPSITRVFSSLPMESMISVSEMSVLLPRLTNFEKPIFSPRAQSSIATHRAPDCEKKPIWPSGGIPAAKDALSELAVSISPRQLGPIIRIPNFLARVASASSRRAPSGPISLKPAAIITTESTFFLPHCSTTFKTAGAGRAIMARSMSAGTEVRSGYALRPKISWAFGFMG